jgi:hypothetical protein
MFHKEEKVLGKAQAYGLYAKQEGGVDALAVAVATISA